MLGLMESQHANRGAGPATPGAAIRARRIYLGLSQEDIAESTSNVINLRLLSRLENNHKSPASLSLSKYNALTKVLRWTSQEFRDATGVAPVTESLPVASEYVPSHYIPIVGTVSAGLTNLGGDMDGMDTLPVDLHAAGLAHVNHHDLVWMRVNGDSMISESAAASIPHGAMVLVEVGAVAKNHDLVIAWLENRETAVIKQYREASDVILRSYNPSGPVFRITDEPIDVRGVVRLVQYKPGA